MNLSSMEATPVVEQAEAREWVRPEVRRVAAGEAEAVGASGDDGIIGIS
ncbi:hypothetical protein ACFQ1E_20125 [Sphingomonas canadensis]|uniref:Uncharacterized protein n=1 Tax=Sphingomonas canadensis TaxID=1219257 RepID=A0ABW3HB27_9SPHN|nr:hypothetical protein [Sphingomonas canadensis]MCW3838435.1 hypothetical protein [Sphingomonas canadensis]